jgi:hypothetical protein
MVAVFAVLAGTGLHAQKLDMRATIPFDFRAGNTLMPAGEYDVYRHDHWVVLRLVDGGKPSTAFLTNGAIAADPVRDARLEFNRYGNAYFLTTIWEPFSHDGRQVPRTSREKELAKRGVVPVQTAVVLASNR